MRTISADSKLSTSEFRASAALAAYENRGVEGRARGLNGPRFAAAIAIACGLACGLDAAAPARAAAARVSGALMSYQGQPEARRDLHFENCVTQDEYLAPTHPGGTFAQSLPPGCYDLRAERGAILRHGIIVKDTDVDDWFSQRPRTAGAGASVRPRRTFSDPADQSGALDCLHFHARSDRGPGQRRGSAGALFGERMAEAAEADRGQYQRRRARARLTTSTNRWISIRPSRERRHRPSLPPRRRFRRNPRRVGAADRR